MIDMLKNAKDLIAKGKALGDSELVQMGMDLLEQYSPVIDSNVPEPQTPQYICENCGHTMSVDKKGRKRCPQCKKHRLVILEQAIPKNPQRTRGDKDEFHRPVRAPNNDRIYYDDQGQQIGKYTRPEPFSPETLTNTFQDDGTEFKDDPVNEKLKAITRVSERTRKPAKLVEVKCDNCNKIDMIHPLHIANSSRYLCNRCISKRSQR